MIGQQGRGGGGVSADDKLQAVWRLCDQRNHKAAVKVSGPDVVNLGETTWMPLTSQAEPQVWGAVVIAVYTYLALSLFDYLQYSVVGLEATLLRWASWTDVANIDTAIQQTIRDTKTKVFQI